MRTALLQSSIPGIPCRRGKVRDVYDLGSTLLLVATDRISAFDWVMPNGIPDKGRVLTQLSNYWFASLAVPHHLLATSIADIELPAGTDRETLAGRSVHVRKTTVFPVECVVRGYLAGSGWKEYRQNQRVCGVPLPAGLRECERLPEPIFTPATKAESGHDLNISFAEMCDIIGNAAANELRARSLEIYAAAAERSLSKGILLADSKFEFGTIDGEILLIDEALTPDSSRFWPAEGHQPGGVQPSFDKQFVRDWLESVGWDKNSPPPVLPDEIVAKTRAKYVEAFERISGESFLWT